MAEESRDSGRIKVVDKRMFTADGELREDFQHLEDSASPKADADRDAPPPPSRPAEPPRAAGSDPPPTAGPPSPVQDAGAGSRDLGPDMGPRGKLGKPGFMDLVGILAEPITLYLGDAKLPDGSSAENLDAARFHIDLLEVVHSKTAGNLTPQESSVLEDLLYQLRLHYVRKRG